MNFVNKAESSIELMGEVRAAETDAVPAVTQGFVIELEDFSFPFFSNVKNQQILS